MDMQHKNSTGGPLGDKGMTAQVDDFLGAVYVFSTMVNVLTEEDLLRDASHGLLTPSQMKLLRLVDLNDGLTVGDAAAFLRVSKAAASKAVDKLVKKLFLQRSSGQTDRREIRLSLTDESRKILARYENAREQKLREIFSMSVPAELSTISALLDCFSARIAIENSSAQPGRLCLQCGTYFRKNCLLRTQLGRQCFHQRREKQSE
jgi:DNA-binding MarR family transcriptional regulator